MAYTRVNWQNSPSHATPLSAENLNVMDEGIENLDAAVTEATGDIADLETTVSGHTTSISGLQTTVGGHTTSIGNLANLTTTEKSNLVGAINEVDADVSDVKEDLEQVETDISTLYDMATPSAYNNDKVPYLFRASGGGKYIGGIEKDTIVGGTFAWNEIWKNYYAINGAVTTLTENIADKDYTLTLATQGTSGDSWKYGFRTSLVTYLVQGHKYLVSGDITASFNTNLRVILMGDLQPTSLVANTKKNVNLILEAGSTVSLNNVIELTFPAMYNQSVGATVRVEKVNVHDLTQLFDSTIADYIYSLEQSTAGSGVAKLKSWGFFTDSYYPYDSGSLKSVEGLEAHVMRDADENIIGSYPLDSDLVLRGKPTLVNGELVYDGDRYGADGSVSVRYGVITLNGSETWEVRSNKEHQFIVKNATSDSFVIDQTTQTTIKNIVATRYMAETWAEFNTTSTTDRTVAFFYGEHWLVFKDSRFSTAQEFKTHLASNPMTVVYLLATPTTETADPYQTPQLVDKNGTEEYVTTGIVPVGHDTDYYLDADSVLTPPSTAGTYSLKVTVASDGSKSYSWVSD